MADEKQSSIVFLCTGNSCRSQMAEGWAKALHANRYQVYSAGIEAHGLNPLAVQVMREVGIDITTQQSQRIEELNEIPFEVVITVCSHADENCPVLPSRARKLHVPFDDPPALARSAQSEDEALDHYRRVRDEIRRFVEGLPDEIAG